MRLYRDATGVKRLAGIVPASNSAMVIKSDGWIAGVIEEVGERPHFAQSGYLNIADSVTSNTRQHYVSLT